jgi:hypothetical protein
VGWPFTGLRCSPFGKAHAGSVRPLDSGCRTGVSRAVLRCDVNKANAEGPPNLWIYFRDHSETWKQTLARALAEKHILGLFSGGRSNHFDRSDSFLANVYGKAAGSDGVFEALTRQPVAGDSDLVRIHEPFK